MNDNHPSGARFLAETLRHCGVRDVFFLERALALNASVVVDVVTDTAVHVPEAWSPLS